MEISINLLMVISLNMLLVCLEKRTLSTQGFAHTPVSRESSELSLGSLLTLSQRVVDCAMGIKWSDSQRDCQV